MPKFAIKIRSSHLAICSALAAALVTVGVGQSDSVEVLSNPAVASSSDARVEKQVKEAERMVEKARDNAAARSALAQAYLSAGRFESAAATFEDAVALGDSSPRNALGMALAYTGAGRNREAASILNQWRGSIPATDLGLALALAGQSEQGVAVLSEALRNGENTPKLRQNLAYAYALDGRWREARVMAAQDVPADQLDARISQWALQGKPEDYNVRVAALLGAPVRSDPGQPMALALNGGPAVGAQPVELAAAPAPIAAPRASAPANGELPPIQTGESFWGTAEPEAVVPMQSPVQQASVSTPVVQPIPAKPSAAVAAAPDPTPYMFKSLADKPVAKPAPKAAPQSAPVKAAAVKAALTVAANPTHLIQLGSFSSEENARRAVKIYQTRNPSLKQHDMQITKALVNGKIYWRVAAGGFNGGSARSMCSTVKGRGGACFAYASKTPWPGAVPANSNLLLARR